jgi:hypothetical protein
LYIWTYIQIIIMAAGLAILGALQAAGQIGYGMYQNNQAKKLQKDLGPRPQYQYNDAKRAVAGQLALAQGEAPGVAQQLQGINQNLANTTQNIQTMAPSGAAGLGALVQANASGMQSYSDVLGQAAQTKLGLQQNYLQCVAGLQNYADKAYEVNQLQPYMEQQQRIADLRAAGASNIGGGIQSGFDTIGSAISAKSINLDPSITKGIADLKISDEATFNQMIKNAGGPNTAFAKALIQEYPQFNVTQ